MVGPPGCCLSRIDLHRAAVCVISQGDRLAYDQLVPPGQRFVIVPAVELIDRFGRRVEVAEGGGDWAVVPRLRKYNASLERLLGPNRELGYPIDVYNSATYHGGKLVNMLQDLEARRAGQNLTAQGRGSKFQITGGNPNDVPPILRPARFSVETFDLERDGREFIENSRAGVVLIGERNGKLFKGAVEFPTLAVRSVLRCILSYSPVPFEAPDWRIYAHVRMLKYTQMVRFRACRHRPDAACTLCR